MGEELARQAPVDGRHGDAGARIGDPGGAGLRAACPGIPYGDGLVKNRYVGRTFIEPSQRQRSGGVRLKLNPLPENIRGKRLVVVDDSIVRGTTTRQVVAMLREAGARRGAPPGLVAAVPVAVPLRHGHRPALRAARRRPRPSGRSPTTSRSTRSRTSSSTGSPPRPGRPPTGSAPRASRAATRCPCP